MAGTAQIAAVTVNHNTSQFVELMVRTLLLTNRSDGYTLDLTVLDNGSSDAALPSLTALLRASGMAFVQTGFDTALAGEKHGAALEAFVARRSDCTYWLFLDADIWFVAPNTVGTLLRELEAADPSMFANQAQIMGYYAGRIIEGAGRVPGASELPPRPPWETIVDGRRYRTTGALRCSPVCALVRNTALFRATVAAVGLTPALRLGAGTAVFYDTFALMTAALEPAGQRFMVSSHVVNHFTMTTYQSESRATKERDCQAMLADLRAGAGMGNPRFRESEWLQAQRSTQ